MAVNLKVSEVQMRESRLGSITGFSGSLEKLYQYSKSGQLVNRDRCFSQGSSCANSCAESYLSRIVDALVISHGPVGCAGGSIGVNAQHKWSQKVLRQPYTNIRTASTNMNELDTVFGAVKKLREAVVEMHLRHHPKAIFLTATCVSGVIGEDLDSIVAELKDELGIPIVPVYCEGFKSRIWASGFDAAYHAVVKYLVLPPKKKTNKINFINFNESARKPITELFGRLGYEPLFLVAGRTVEEIQGISESAATVSVCGTLGTYGGQALQEEYGVPYINATYPNGIQGFETWLREIGRVLDKQPEVEAYIAQQREWAVPALEKLKAKLKGTRAVVGMGPGFAYDYIRVLNELDIEVVHSSSWHYDQKYDDEKGSEAVHIAETVDRNLPVSVSDLQNFELINILRTHKPDIFVTRHGGSGWVFKLGLVVLMVSDEYQSFGYHGTLTFAQTVVDALSNRALAEIMVKHMKLPYTGWWLNQNADTFLQEPVHADTID